MEQGLVLMVVGMVTVFSFLILLVGAMIAAASFFAKFAHLFPEEQIKVKPSAAVDPGVDIAIALAAIRAKRS
ncbi:MAG: oxaloacetate decarboxylase (Na+ extruding) subunit gamma [Verrucomicrobiota bacterium]|jgi:Na+-transporting methylmalonyl-CoA/oxaloacetate decarboxylase gamma subunit|nr:oxaloacetate decarboxylase (Na+ extruding) subunit gamma [Verrucomicrobiota bacterium]MDK2963831.1 oxaloacetate decarboxylase (Na+ extruding) subunit gamma [Verrucomicrobiota bacterium]